MSKSKFYLIQDQLVWENPSANRKHFEAIIRGLTEPGLVVLPEMFSTGFSMQSHKLAEDMQGETINWLRQLAATTGMTLCGSLIVFENSRYFNRFVFVTPNSLEYYDKRHLFSIAGEDSFFSRGNRRLLIQWEGWRILPLICYDLRFPVWSRNQNNYDLLLYVANWPASRRNVWDALLRARAIENQALVLGVNRIGSDGEGLAYNGGTCAISERGDIVAAAPDNSPSVLEITYDSDTIADFRQKFPAWKDADSFTISG
ncbi:MAG: amidohydrolase [Bacteroidales bacterium]|nr:amidohydrolase [Bacteroidales bacterium]